MVNEIEGNEPSTVVSFNPIKGIKVGDDLGIRDGRIFDEAISFVLKKNSRKSVSELRDEIVARLTLSFKEYPILSELKSKKKIK